MGYVHGTLLTSASTPLMQFKAIMMLQRDLIELAKLSAQSLASGCSRCSMHTTAAEVDQVLKQMHH